MTSTQGHRADYLRLIAERLALPGIKTVAQSPGMSEAYRISIQYHDARHPDQVATLTRTQFGRVMLTVAYKRVHHTPSFEFEMTLQEYQAFDIAMRRAGFDRRDDQADLPFIGADLWLIERASGSFVHNLVLSPTLADGVYGWMVEAVKTHLPLAIRAISLG